MPKSSFLHFRMSEQDSRFRLRWNSIQIITNSLLYCEILKMSRTATLSSINNNQTRLRVVGYPSDYDLHHSNSLSLSPPTENETQNLNSHPSLNQQSANENSENHEWANHYRRVPPYRPINHDLDQGERRVYLNAAERAFITMMFLGVRSNAVRLSSSYLASQT